MVKIGGSSVKIQISLSHLISAHTFRMRGMNGAAANEFLFEIHAFRPGCVVNDICGDKRMNEFITNFRLACIPRMLILPKAPK